MPFKRIDALTKNPWVMLGAGIVLGAVGPRSLMEQPMGRRALKTVIKGGYSVYEWASTQIEKVREDVSDLVAEAVHEQAQSGGSATSKGEDAHPEQAAK